MGRSWILLPLVVAALAVLLLLVTGREGDEAGRAVDRDEKGAEGVPLLRGRGAGEVGEANEGDRDEDDPEGVEAPPPPKGKTRLQGTIRLRDTKEPVEGGRVVLSYIAPGDWTGTEAEFRSLGKEERKFGAPKGHARIHANGAYGLYLPRGAIVHAVEVERPASYETVLGSFLALHREVWLVLDAADMRLDLEVEPGLELRGEARDAATGDPVPGVLVKRGVLFGPRAGARGEEDGSFRVTGIHEGDTYAPDGLVFEVTHPDYLPERFRVRYDRGREAYPFVGVEMTRGVRIGGRVTVNGEAAPNAADVLLVKRAPGPVPWAEEERVLARTRSDGTGRFLFPAVPPTADADLVVPAAGGGYTGGGAGARVEGLDLTRDRYDLHADLATVYHVPVEPVTPDGEVVGARASHVFYEDLRGELRQAGYRGGTDPLLWLVGLVAGHEHRVVAFAETKDENGLTRAWRGEATATGGETKEVRVSLRPWSHPGIPHRQQVQTCTVGSAWYAQHVWQIRVTNADTGRPIARRTIEVETDTGTRISTALYDEGLVRLSLPPGRTRLRLHVEGYESVALTLAPREPGYEEAELPLTPLEVR